MTFASDIIKNTMLREFGITNPKHIFIIRDNKMLDKSFTKRLTNLIRNKPTKAIVCNYSNHVCLIY